MRCVVVRYLYRQSRIERVVVDTWITTVLAGEISRLERLRVKQGGLLHLCRKSTLVIQFHANHFVLGEFELLCGGGDACFAGKCQSANDIISLGLNLIGCGPGTVAD